MRSHLDERAANRNAGQELAGNPAGGHAHGRLAGGGAPPATIVANAVFGVVGIIGMAGPVRVPDFAVVLRALVDVVDHEADRGSGGDLNTVVAGHHARQDLHLIGFLTLGGEARGPGPAPVEVELKFAGLERNHRRAAVHHAADSRPVALTPGRDTEQMAKSIV